MSDNKKERLKPGRKPKSIEERVHYCLVPMIGAHLFSVGHSTDVNTAKRNTSKMLAEYVKSQA
jgi:uroporphyrinogen-III decarboxylase